MPSTADKNHKDGVKSACDAATEAADAEYLQRAT